MVQWLRLHTCSAGGAGSVPDWGTKSPLALPTAKERNRESFLTSLARHTEDPPTLVTFPATPSSVPISHGHVPRRASKQAPQAFSTGSPFHSAEQKALHERSVQSDMTWPPDPFRTVSLLLPSLDFGSTAASPAPSPFLGHARHTP